MPDKKHIYDDERELRGEAPTLYGTGKKDPFRAPEGYFDTLPARIMERRKSGLSRTRFTNPRLWLPLAAAAAVAGAGIYTGLLRDGVQNTMPATIPYTASALPADVLVDELVHYYNVDEGLIAEVMAGTEPGYEAEQPTSTNNGNNHPADEAIIAYLVQNDIDLQTIIDEL